MTEPGKDLLAPLRETLTRRHFLRSGSHLLAGAAMARLGGALPLAAALLKASSPMAAALVRHAATARPQPSGVPARPRTPGRRVLPRSRLRRRP